METILLMYLAAGAVAGLLAGLLGIGGGLVIVPMLVFCFSLQHVDPAVTMHLALGTSMASIIFTSVSSFRAHHRRGAVHWGLVRRITLGIFTGTLAYRFVFLAVTAAGVFFRANFVKSDPSKSRVAK